MKIMRILAVALVLLALALGITWTADTRPIGAADGPQPSEASPSKAATSEGEHTERTSVSTSTSASVTAIRVLDAETATPIPDARACNAPPSTRLRNLRADDLCSDAAGLLTIPDGMSGDLLVGAPRYSSLRVVPVVGRIVEARLHPMPTVPVRCVDEFDVPLEGVLVAASAVPIVGRPIADAEVVALSGDGGPRCISCARSDSDGIARVAIPSVGDYWLRPWSQHHGCTEAWIFERQARMDPDDPPTLHFRELHAVAVYSDESPVRTCEIAFPPQSRGGVDRDMRHMLFEAEFVTADARWRLESQWPAVEVRTFVATKGSPGIPVEVSGLLQNGRRFSVVATSMPVSRLVPTQVAGDPDAAVASLIVRSSVAAPEGFDVRLKESRLRLRTEADRVLLAPEGDYVVSVVGEWVGGKPPGQGIRMRADEAVEVTIDVDRHRPVLVRIVNDDVPSVGRLQLLWHLEKGGDKRSFNWNPRTDSLTWLPIGQHDIEVMCPGYQAVRVPFEVADGPSPTELVIDMVAQ